MANLYDMYYAQAMNHYLAARQDPDANAWAVRVKECFRRDMLPQTTAVAAPAEPGGFLFEADGGYVSMEAEHYYRAEAPQFLKC